MVCSAKICFCGNICQRLLCREQAADPEAEIVDPNALTQLAEAKDVTFTQPLQVPLSIGSHIVCTGTPSEDLPWFAINIGHGDVDSGKADIAVHFNVRMPLCYIVRNARKSGKWGAEETTSFRMFPFKLNRPFTIEILVDETQTLWAVDGEHYCGFAHRVPAPFAATWVQITGVRDATLNVQKTDVYPTLAPELFEVPFRKSYEGVRGEDEPSWRRNIMVSMTNGVPEGHQLVLSGRLRPMLHSFTFDLVDQLHEWPHANIHLHANVRAHVESHLARQLVVLNAWFGSWGPERRQRTARLIPGTEVTFRIVRGTSEWAVFADNMLIGELELRGSPQAVKGVRIRGDFYPDQLYLCPATS